jgi:hypothetical protein
MKTFETFSSSHLPLVAFCSKLFTLLSSIMYYSKDDKKMWRIKEERKSFFNIE